MTDEKELQQKYIDYQINEQQIRQISQQFQELNNKILELEYIKQSLDEVKDIKKGTEILAPLSSGIFLKADIKDTKKLMVNIGSQTVVPKSVPEVKGLIENQLEEIDSIRNQLMVQLDDFTLKNRRIEEELQKLSEE